MKKTGSDYKSTSKTSFLKTYSSTAWTMTSVQKTALRFMET